MCRKLWATSGPLEDHCAFQRKESGFTTNAFASWLEGPPGPQHKLRVLKALDKPLPLEILPATMPKYEPAISNNSARLVLLPTTPTQHLAFSVFPDRLCEKARALNAIDLTG